MSDEEREDEDEKLDEAELSPEETARLEEEERRRGYFPVSRGLSASLIFVLPVLLVYEVGVFFLGSDIAAIAEVIKSPLAWLKTNPTQILGADAMVWVNGLLIATVFIAVIRLGHLGALRGGVFLGMLVESFIYAMLIGPIALATLTGELHFGHLAFNLSHFGEKIVLACGAGLYEEILFRVIILGLIFYLAKELGKLNAFTAGFLALVLSGAIFSAMHFLSPDEAVSMGAFIYRLSAGMVLGLIFLARGAGIAVMAHTLYDVYVLCFTAGQ